MREISLHAIVLAGGSGKRLREFTRTWSGEPIAKQFCSFGGHRTLLRRTVDRILPLVPPERVVVVTAAGDVQRARACLGGLEAVTIVPQPSDRGTAPGVLLPLSHVLERDPDAIVVVTPSDHGVRNAQLFEAGIRRVHALVARGEAGVVVLGTAPSGPSVDYGWIVAGDPAPNGLRPVRQFVEKPPAEAAAQLWSSGAVWSTMVLVARGKALWRLYRQRLPHLATVFEIALTLPPAERAAYLRGAYGRLETSDFSRAVLAGGSGLSVLAWGPALGWTDLGTSDRVQAWLAEGDPLESLSYGA